ncbi:2-phosphosulfolactate phosphatase [Actinophytocola sp.]|uniref:2-phosphosulfolactate phosphatase n=1 Tax=Actinophytocola sp. TaxID=1872138 RepID=UPI003D6A35FF
MTVYAQDTFDLRLEWDRDGVAALGPHCAVLIVVDVLVFSTTVDIALGRGGRVLPLPWRDERAAEAARAAGAVLTHSGLTSIEGHTPADGPADRHVDERGGRVGGWSTPVADGAAREWTLRPSSLVELPAGTFLAISSPNGATLCAAAASTGATVLAGCLRNASAVAAAAVQSAGDAPIGIVPVGERWRDTPDRRLRPGIEEILGAGAIADAIIRLRRGTGAGAGTRGETSAAAVPARAGARPWQVSAEAEVAAVTYRAVAGRVGELLATSVSGLELIAAGVAEDVRLAAQVDASSVVPLLTDGVLVAR